jgi:hypothetical protein
MRKRTSSVTAALSPACQERHVASLRRPSEKFIEKVRRIAESKGITWPTICFGQDRNPIIDSIQLVVYPVILLQDRDGQIVDTHVDLEQLSTGLSAFLESDSEAG